MPKASSNPTQHPKRRERAAATEHGSSRGRVERMLAIGIVAFAATALLGFAATLMHVAFRDSAAFFAATAWQYAFWLPLVALPLMILCLVALVIVSAAGKARNR